MEMENGNGRIESETGAGHNLVGAGCRQHEAYCGWLPSDIDLCGFSGPLGTCCRRVYLVCSRLPRLLAEKLSRQWQVSSVECGVESVCRL